MASTSVDSPSRKLTTQLQQMTTASSSNQLQDVAATSTNQVQPMAVDQLTTSETEKRQMFVQGWEFVQVLGEGLYGDVSLLVNIETQEGIACKTILMENHPNPNEVKKEIAILRTLVGHPNIIRYFGARNEPDVFYIFLEYASGGELYDRIEPDSGMEEGLAHRYFKQLLIGLDFLHTRGIVHRDIKPENLLLDDRDNLKISDFGFATIFRSRGRERKLQQRCGTRSYVAPEVLSESDYFAQPIDIWSSGIVLVAMLCGELPWKEPVPKDEDFAAWINRKSEFLRSPWRRVNNIALSLLRKILCPQPARRLTLPEIKDHRWMRKTFSLGLRNQGSDSSLSESDQPDLLQDCKRKRTAMEHDSASQPAPVVRSVSRPQCMLDPSSDCSVRTPLFVSFTDMQCGSTQPARLDSLCYKNNGNGSEVEPRNSGVPPLVRRMTRFFVRHDRATVSKLLCRQLEGEPMCLQWKINANGVITASTTDERLTFKISIYTMSTHRTLVDCRLSHGDGLEFKRKFQQLKRSLHKQNVLCAEQLDWRDWTSTILTPRAPMTEQNKA